MLLDTLGRDIRLSLRSLARERKFSATVLLIIALCLGANIAIFAVVYGVLLKPLPFRDPEQLVLVANAYPKAGVERAGTSVPHYIERKEGVGALAESGAYRGSGVTIGEAGSPERVDSISATPSFFRVLGVNAALGRTFTDEEGFYGKHQVALISDGLWRQRFNADPEVIGRKMRVNSEDFTIVGVMAPGFRFLSEKASVWTPLCFSDDDRKPERRHANNMSMIARLRPGETVASAQAQVDALNERAMESDPFGKLVKDAGFHAQVFSLAQDHVRELRPVLLLLQAGVLFLMLIGLVNLTNLMLVRATGRAKEYCVRQALGAGRGQLARSLITETVLLALAGGALGLALGAAGLRGIELMVSDLSLPIEGGIGFAVIVAALAGSLILGLALAIPVVWHTLHGNLTDALSVESRGGTTTRAVHRLRHGLIVAQIALAFVLLAGTGLLGLSFSRVLAVNPGFRPDHVLTGRLALPWLTYKEEKQRLALVEKLTLELQAVPGVTAVGFDSSAPFSGSNDNNAIWVEGYAPAPGEAIQAHYTRGVAGDYFTSIGVPLREGRFITTADSHAESPVCVVDEDVARRYWPKESALGHRLANGPPGNDQTLFTIVGVVGAVKQNDLADRKANGAIYFPYRHYAALHFTVAVRTQQAPELAGPALRAAVLRTDPELPLHDLKTMEARIEDSVANRRVPLLLAGIFAGVALVLAAVGIYGVLAYAVAQRQREIGVRMALGAQAEQILLQFLGLGARLLLVGLPIGILGAWFAGRAMEGLLFGVQPANLFVLGGTVAVLSVVALLACLLPSRRAAQVAPIEALRGN